MLYLEKPSRLTKQLLHIPRNPMRKLIRIRLLSIDPKWKRVADFPARAFDLLATMGRSAIPPASGCRRIIRRHADRLKAHDFIDPFADPMDVSAVIGPQVFCCWRRMSSARSAAMRDLHVLMNCVLIAARVDGGKRSDVTVLGHKTSRRSVF